MRSPATVVLSLAALAMLLGGCSLDPKCGYTTQSQFTDDVKTVYAPIWTRGKDVYRRDIEMRVTEAVQKRVAQNTPYRLANKGCADTELSGEIVEITQQVIAYNPDTGNPREMEITFLVNFAWKDLRTGKTIMEKKHFHVSGTYIPQAPFDEDFFQGSEDVINRLAQRVVEQMEAPW
jgi:hypothetical protein